MIDALLFRLWCVRMFTPVQVRVYVRGEHEFAAVPDFLRHYRKGVWGEMSERERRFVKWLGWTTPDAI